MLSRRMSMQHWRPNARVLQSPCYCVERRRYTVVTTRFGNVISQHRWVEIGSTWLSTECLCTGVNTDVKYQLLKHAFAECTCIRVELKTDSRNRNSRRPVERLCANERGTLRQHNVTDQGLRATVYYNILYIKCPINKANLEKKLVVYADESKSPLSKLALQIA